MSRGSCSALTRNFSWSSRMASASRRDASAANRMVPSFSARRWTSRRAASSSDFSWAFATRNRASFEASSSSWRGITVAASMASTVRCVALSTLPASISSGFGVGFGLRSRGGAGPGRFSSANHFARKGCGFRLRDARLAGGTPQGRGSGCAGWRKGLGLVRRRGDRGGICGPGDGSFAKCILLCGSRQKGSPLMLGSAAAASKAWSGAYASRAYALHRLWAARCSIQLAMANCSVRVSWKTRTGFSAGCIGQCVAQRYLKHSETS